MANTALINNTDFSEIQKLGFTKDDDGSGDVRGIGYFMQNDRFRIDIDCYMDVSLRRLNPDTDYIKIAIDDLFDLKELIDFIQD